MKDRDRLRNDLKDSAAEWEYNYITRDETAEYKAAKREKEARKAERREKSDAALASLFSVFDVSDDSADNESHIDFPPAPDFYYDDEDDEDEDLDGDEDEYGLDNKYYSPDRSSGIYVESDYRRLDDNDVKVGLVINFVLLAIVTSIVISVLFFANPLGAIAIVALAVMVCFAVVRALFYIRDRVLENRCKKLAAVIAEAEKECEPISDLTRDDMKLPFDTITTERGALKLSDFAGQLQKTVIMAGDRRVNFGEKAIENVETPHLSYINYDDIAGCKVGIFCKRSLFFKVYIGVSVSFCLAHCCDEKQSEYFLFDETQIEYAKEFMKILRTCRLFYDKYCDWYAIIMQEQRTEREYLAAVEAVKSCDKIDIDAETTYEQYTAALAGREIRYAKAKGGQDIPNNGTISFSATQLCCRFGGELKVVDYDNIASVAVREYDEMKLEFTLKKGKRKKYRIEFGAKYPGEFVEVFTILKTITVLAERKIKNDFEKL